MSPAPGWKETRRGKARATALACALAISSAPSAAEDRSGIEAFALHDDNPSLAFAGSRVRAETVTGMRATFARTSRRDEQSGWMLAATAECATHPVYPGLRNVALGGEAAYRFQPVVAYASPWYEFAMAVERRQYADSALRDATRATLRLALGRRFTDRLHAWAGIEANRTLADHAAVFDAATAGVFVEAGLAFGVGKTAYVRLSAIGGDHVIGVADNYVFRGRAKSIGEDPVFGDEYYAYRTDARTGGIETGATFAVNGGGVLDVGIKRFDTRVAGGDAYKRTLLLAGWRYRFR